MATFSTNQARQLYVAKVLPTDATPVTNAGDIKVKADTVKSHLYFEYMGAGGQTRSDLIDIKSIAYAKATDADSLARPLSKVKLVLDSSVNSGNPVAGQDYILRIAFRNYIGLSEEDQYWKFGMVHAVSGMTAEQFYQSMLTSLKNNMAREESKLVNLSLTGEKAAVTMTTNSGITVTANNFGTSGNSLRFAIASISAATAGVAVSTTSGVTTITASLTDTAKTIGDLKALIAADDDSKDLITITGTNATEVAVEDAVALTGGSTTGVVIEEAEQPWVLGTMPQDYIPFDVQPTTITVGGDDRIWGTVNTITSTSKVENGKKIADLEYFCMGERGDIYRGVGFPNIIRTKYLVDPDVKYNVLDIHYSYQGNGEGVQKSEKDITLVVPKVGASNNISNKLINDIITKINSVAGLSIDTLDATAPSGT